MFFSRILLSAVFLLLNSYIRYKYFTMRKIKMISQAHDAKTGKIYPEGTILDLGEERNTNAVNNGLAVWVDSRDFTEAKKEVENEKKEETPKKTTSSVKGKKIETK